MEEVRSKESGADRTANCPQRALALVIQAFDDGVEQYGDANDMAAEEFYVMAGLALVTLNEISPNTPNHDLADRYAKVAGWCMCCSELCARAAEMEADHD